MPVNSVSKPKRIDLSKQKLGSLFPNVTLSFKKQLEAAKEDEVEKVKPKGAKDRGVKGKVRSNELGRQPK